MILPKILIGLFPQFFSHFFHQCADRLDVLWLNYWTVVVCNHLPPVPRWSLVSCIFSSATGSGVGIEPSLLHARRGQLASRTTRVYGVRSSARLCERSEHSRAVRSNRETSALVVVAVLPGRYYSCVSSCHTQET